MNEHHKILFPAFLIIFASFLAFNMDNLDFSEPNYFFEKISSEASSITGMVVVPGGSCADADNTIFGLYELSNSHVAMFGTFTDVDGLFCAQLDSAIATTDPTRVCSGTNLVGFVANGNSVTGPIDNAHFYAPETDVSNLPPSGEYAEVCYDNVVCATRNACLSNEECLFSFEGEGGITYNAHVGGCGTYVNQLCCTNDDADICVNPTGTYDCDIYDVDYDNPSMVANTMVESQISDVSCTSACSGSGCCTIYPVACNKNPLKLCKKFYDLLPSDPWWQNSDNTNAICYVSNAGIPLWGLTAEATETSCTDGFDNDCDGVADGLDNPDCTGVADNCPAHPNHPSLGTCINNATKSNPDPTATPIICSSDSDCLGKTMVPYGGGAAVSVTYCENSQANKDGDETSGDGCGNACDIDSNDANTCLNLNDQGGEPPTACGLALLGANFDWNPGGLVERGTQTEIILDLAGNTECDGITFSVQVINVDAVLGDSDYFSVLTPLPFTVNNGIGLTTWLAENNNPGINPSNSKWIANGYDFGGTAAPLSSILEVTASSSFCGDGNKDSGEQCDDGNNEGDDGCSEKCLKEGLDGPGSNDECNRYCVKFSKVCSGDGATVYTCGDWDGNGCNELDLGTSCSGGKVCNSEFGNCIEPGCNVKNFAKIKNPSCSEAPGASYVCGSWSDCINGVKIRDCKSCNPGSCSLPPLGTVACSNEPSVKGSFFDLWSLVLAIGILGVYYVLRNSKIKFV